MISAGEITRSVFGAWMLARFNKGGITFFDNSVEGFWRSFWSAAVVLPGYAILLLFRYGDAKIGVGFGTAFYVHAVAYIIDWTAFPFLMLYVARWFNRDQWYCRYIAANNWSVVIQVTLMLVIVLAALSGLMPSPLVAWATNFAFVFILAYKGFIAHLALQTTWPGAVGIVFIDLCVSLLLERWTTKLLQLQPMVSG